VGRRIMAVKRLNIRLRELADDQAVLQNVFPTVENHSKAVRLLTIITIIIPYDTVLIHGIGQMRGNHTPKELSTAVSL
jgi:hypothetical protein